MRDIKFRARDAATGKILTQLYMGQCFHWVNHERQSDIVIEQFTGLKDKNGVEIYEGDIVQMIGDDIFSDEYVSWMNDDCSDDEVSSALFDSIPKIPINTDLVVMDRFPSFWIKNESFGYEGEDLQQPCDYEVIGNIYENPELLNNLHK